MASRSLLIALSATVCLIDSTLAQNSHASDKVRLIDSTDTVENDSDSVSTSMENRNAMDPRDPPADAAVEIAQTKEEKVELVLEKFLQSCEIAEKGWKPRARGLGAPKPKVIQKRENLKQAISALTDEECLISTSQDEGCQICDKGSLTRNGAGVVGCKSGHFMHLDCQISSGKPYPEKEQKCPKCSERFDTAIVDFYRESGFTNLFKKQPHVDAALSKPAHVGTEASKLRWKVISLEYQSFFDVFGAALCESGLRFPWAVELEKAPAVNEALATLFAFYKKHAGRSKAWKEAAFSEAEQAARPAAQAGKAAEAVAQGTEAMQRDEALAKINEWLEKNRAASDSDW